MDPVVKPRGDKVAGVAKQAGGGELVSQDVDSSKEALEDIVFSP